MNEAIFSFGVSHQIEMGGVNATVLQRVSHCESWPAWKPGASDSTNLMEHDITCE